MSNSLPKYFQTEEKKAHGTNSRTGLRIIDKLAYPIYDGIDAIFHNLCVDRGMERGKLQPAKEYQRNEKKTKKIHFYGIRCSRLIQRTQSSSIMTYKIGALHFIFEHSLPRVNQLIFLY